MRNVFRGACASKGSPVPLTRICPHQGRKPSKAPVWPRPLLVWQMLLQTPAAAASGAAEPECTAARSATPALQPILHVTPQLVRPMSSIAQTCMHAVDEPLSTVVLLQLGTLLPGQPCITCRLRRSCARMYRGPLIQGMQLALLMLLPSWPLAAQARIYKMHTGPTLFLACR